MDFTLGRFVSEDRQKCSVEFGVIWTLGMFNISTFWINIAPCSSRGGSGFSALTWDPSQVIQWGSRHKQNVDWRRCRQRGRLWWFWFSAEVFPVSRHVVFTSFLPSLVYLHPCVSFWLCQVICFVPGVFVLLLMFTSLVFLNSFLCSQRFCFVLCLVFIFLFNFWVLWLVFWDFGIFWMLDIFATCLSLCVLCVWVSIVLTTTSTQGFCASERTGGDILSCCQ